MKKYFSLILVLVLAFAMTISAFAADNAVDGQGAGTGKADVTAQFAAGEDKNDPTDVATVYHVTLEWAVTSTLKYSAGTTTYTWNADDTKYEASTAGEGWTGTAQVKVTVTNKSNAEIDATAVWAKVGDIEATVSFSDNGQITVPSAAKDITTVTDGAKGEEQTGSITASITAITGGTITTDNAVIGTVNLTLAPKA